MPHYTRAGLKISGDRSDGDTFLLQIDSKYRGGQDRDNSECLQLYLKHSGCSVMV